mmetsp:Transcript_8512/g.24209  ORF Transcript_8512/g.24209 Transcript_8512/m.24209 type:complete len:224 (+) Transcript_8512:419-1090(+)
MRRKLLFLYLTPPTAAASPRHLLPRHLHIRPRRTAVTPTDRCRLIPSLKSSPPTPGGDQAHRGLNGRALRPRLNPSPRWRTSSLTVQASPPSLARLQRSLLPAEASLWSRVLRSLDPRQRNAPRPSPCPSICVSLWQSDCRSGRSLTWIPGVGNGWIFFESCSQAFAALHCAHPAAEALPTGLTKPTKPTKSLFSTPLDAPCSHPVARIFFMDEKRPRPRESV